MCIEESIKDALVNKLSVEVPMEFIELDFHLKDNLGIDSIQIAELRVICEHRFNVQIDDDDFRSDSFASVRRLGTLVRRLQALKASYSARHVTVQHDLTEAQSAVFELAAQGLTDAQIAARAHISAHTVNFHLRQIFSKLGVHSRIELARLCSYN